MDQLTIIDKLGIHNPYELWIMGVDYNLMETVWHKVKSYRTYESAVQAIADRKISVPSPFLNRKWKIRNKIDNSISYYD